MVFCLFHYYGMKRATIPAYCQNTAISVSYTFLPELTSHSIMAVFANFWLLWLCRMSIFRKFRGDQGDVVDQRDNNLS